MNRRPGKPRSRVITEIRGPYYSPMGTRYLTDVLETMGEYVDGLKFAGGSFSLVPRARVRELIDLAHAHDVLVSTGSPVFASCRACRGNLCCHQERLQQSKKWRAE
jgi:phosphosulfolactate synthase (CoM biosynthesis protein A)